VLVPGQLNLPGVIGPREIELGKSNAHAKEKVRPFFSMNPDRQVARRLLDSRLVGLDERVGTRPPLGWVREIRVALGMSTYELAVRMGIVQSRASKIERAEVEGAIRLQTLGRVAEALNCRLVYAFVPDESLEHIVRYQAERKAAEALGTGTWDQSRVGDEPLMADVTRERLLALAYYLVDRRGLWRADPPPPGAGELSDENGGADQRAR
jgi:predicted DNA-binding mobile mystery protein A